MWTAICCTGTDAPSCARRRLILDEVQREVKLSSSDAFPALRRRPEGTGEWGPPIGPLGIIFSASPEKHTVKRLDTRGPLARPRTDAGRWRYQRRRRFSRGNRLVRDRRQSGFLHVHQRQVAPGATLAAILLDLERMLVDGAVNVAVGFHVETGGSQAATKRCPSTSGRCGRWHFQEQSSRLGAPPCPAEGTASAERAPPACQCR